MSQNAFSSSEQVPPVNSSFIAQEITEVVAKHEIKHLRENMGRIFDHIDLRVHRMDECAPFYRSLLPLLGFTELVAIEGWLQFEAAGGGVTEFFGLTEDRGHRPNRSRIAFWAESVDRVNSLAAELRVIGAMNVDGPEYVDETYYAVYFDDPSGNALEICYRAKKFNVR